MELGELQKNWEEFARIDPLWAVLTDPSKKNNRWDPQEFFATGEDEIACLMDHVATLPLSLRRGRALDFGCGIGRLTLALCRHFEQCAGVDIAPSMIELAREYNRFGDRCQYYVNAAADLRLFEDGRFDFIYSNIVLQHIPPKYSVRYIRDFVRVLTPGGMAVFQVPSEVARAPAEPPLDTMFKARIAVLPSSLTAAPGAKVQVVANVTNTSGRSWPARSAAQTKYQLHLRNHWLTALGEMRQMNDGRADLVEDVQPSEEITLSLTVTAPVEPGEYILELDMVQEHVAWFKDKGSPTCRVPVRVTAPPASTAMGAAPQPTAAPTAMGLKQPKMDMYSIPRATVINLVTAEGARVLEVEEFSSAGASLVSYRYYVIK
ncbi:MAG: methyltransferase domain-containing protein [Thermoanaerobaculia bacterium]